MRANPNSGRRAWAAGLPLRVALAVLSLGPVAALVVYAGATRWFYPALLPAAWTLDPLQEQLSSPRTREALLTSLLIAGSVTGLSLLIGLPAAYVLGLRRFRGRLAVLLLLFLPSVVPPLATGMGLNILFLRLGLAGGIIGVVLVHLVPVLPYTVFALLGVFARYDEGYEQQARTLGAGRAQVIWRVTLPLAGPGIIVAGLFAFLVSWSQYVLTLLIGGGQVISLPLLLFAAVSGGRPASIATLALIFATPPLLAIALTSQALAGGTARVEQQY
jgi:putative spermidine/putrescine transport system permease protein